MARTALLGVSEDDMRHSVLLVDGVVVHTQTSSAAAGTVGTNQVNIVTEVGTP